MKFSAIVALVFCACAGTSEAGVRIKDLGRFDGVRENVAIGYGLVVGLSGTGDSQRSIATLQSVSNMLKEFGLNVPTDAVSVRNVAAVIVTVNLPAFLRAGDKLDVTVSSMSDATSLSGGTLLVTPLLAGDRQVYAMAQGPLSVGGYKFEQNGTLKQKNHATAGTIPEGATAEKNLTPVLMTSEGELQLILNQPDFVTATRVASAINDQIKGVSAAPVDAGRIRLRSPTLDEASLVRLVAAVETLLVEPDEKARVVVNERTGTIVSGGHVALSAVTITQGDINVAITQRFNTSQPTSPVFGINPGVRTTVVPESTVDVAESELHAVRLDQGATIGELVTALRAIRASTRDVIAILQGIKRAGALHAELVIQ